MGKKCLLSTFALYFASHCAQAVAVSPDCASLCTSHQSSPYCLALRKDDARGDAFAKSGLFWLIRIPTQSKQILLRHGSA